jgi:regulator of protease activity HflC (stomatin/prohibitin superfamily)
MGTALLLPLLVAGILGIFSSVRILYEYERAVVFRLGKLMRARGPGLIFLMPFGIDRAKKMDLRVVALDIRPQDTITRDNVSLAVNAVVYFRVADPVKAVVEIEDYYFATSQLAQTTLRSVIGQSELDELLAERERINHVIQKLIDAGTDAWGIEVTGVEIKDIDLPKEMKRAMAKQAEAERERRAKIIGAEGEYQASKRLGQAADVMARHPAALQLRYLQTLVEVAAENNSTTLFPIPIDIFRGITEKFVGAGASPQAAPTPEPDPTLEELDEEARALERGESRRLLGEGAQVDPMSDASQRSVSRTASGRDAESGDAKR